MMFRSLVLVILLALLSGCYCRSVVSTASPRNLRPAKGYTVCGDHQGEGLKNEATVYYGVPQMDRANIESRYDLPSIKAIEYGRFCQFGVRGERYLKSPLVNLEVLGLGLDYSYDHFSVRSVFNDITSDSLDRYSRHRAMFSVNHMTWVRPKFIGYLLLQGGIQQTFIRSEYITPGSIVSRSKLPVAFDYRIAYGFQFFLNGPWGVNLEGGYGGGAYGRVGLFLWF